MHLPMKRDSSVKTVGKREMIY